MTFYYIKFRYDQSVKCLKNKSNFIGSLHFISCIDTLINLGTNNFHNREYDMFLTQLKVTLLQSQQVISPVVKNDVSRITLTYHWQLNALVIVKKSMEKVSSIDLVKRELYHNNWLWKENYTITIDYVQTKNIIRYMTIE